MASLLVVSALPAQAVKFTDATGAVINLPARAQRVVSLSPALTEIFFAAGAGSKIVGVTTYCNYPLEVNALPKVGGYGPDQLSVESIIALRPDIVVGEASAHGSMASQFASLGIRVAFFNLKDFDAINSAITLAGEIAGDKKIAQAMVDDITKRLKAVSSRLSQVKDANKPVVFWEVWDEPLMTAGPNTFIGQILTYAGAKNAFADTTQDWPMISLESLLTRHVDVIMSSSMHRDALTVEKLAARPGWTSIKAVKERRIEFLDDDLSSRPAPRYVEAIEMVARVLYPELF